MERDKILTIRVNSELYNKAKTIIDENTEWKYGGYFCKFSNYCYGKFSFADLFEKCLKDFIQENEKDKKMPDKK